MRSAFFLALRHLGYPSAEVIPALLTGLLLALGPGLAISGGVAALPFIGFSAAAYVLLRRRAPAPMFRKQHC